MSFSRKDKGFTFFRESSPKRQRGFTLIEILIAITIISILVILGVVSYSTSQKRARDAQRRSDLQKLALALEEYYQDHKAYPDTGSNFQSGGRTCNDEELCCLLGGSIASAAPTNDLDCTPPYNIYIANGEQSKLPIDPWDFNIATIGSSYSYVSNGQSYVLVAKKYEGKPPAENSFNTSSNFWSQAITWDPVVANWQNKYYITDPSH